MLYGERGVGKTSLSCIIQEYLEQVGKIVVAPRVNCVGSEDFSSIWRKAFAEIKIVEERRKIGFGEATHKQLKSIADKVGKKVTPDDVRRVLSSLGGKTIPIIIIDEYDRIADKMGPAFSDTLKMLSDHSAPATIVLVGVADNVETLIRDHQSVERALAQIRVPRMSLVNLRR